ncbi:helix-turn-helix domain-containing protein [Vibrio superstes]|uniref:AraC family transcriptional regulator n=1 Tax=Vibrio superstes NBRC 103154 TaxID=1219062 RepID=A0A511QQR0_9VIBR|nr:helix-turn-helix domain-containing protein [Vibrio superstes]GEM78902.1 AraC family transcriptional regulator [Vibrio superstes NBRC 103154]
MTNTLHITSISELHAALGLDAPAHPLVSFFHPSQVKQGITSSVKVCFDLYLISLKDSAHCTIGYGNTTYDFDIGTMTFLAPGQEVVIEATEPLEDSLGWTIAFHPQLIARSDLSSKMSQFTFFEYQNSEALHLSERERVMVTDIASSIGNETEMNMDKHTQSLICSSIELLLKYCSRFYDRQFIVRADLNHDYMRRFNQFLDSYYQGEKPFEQGIPTVQYCGKEIGLSPYYLSDLIKKETGKTALEHIHLFLIERAKSQILDTSDSITQIAYELGFEYPQHFSKLFKAKTGVSPRQFRNDPTATH